LTKGERKATKETDPMYSLIEYDENMAIAYLVRKMPETFANSLRVLMEIKYRFPNEKVTSNLDFGAGLGRISV
jgi:ribosomal protein RSM22 (predicted rRNA methylase)